MTKLATEMPMLGRPRADGKPPITREQVLQVARTLFSNDGVAATSIRSIAEQLHSRPASIFHLFPTKEHIVVAVANGIYATALDHFLAVAALDAAPDVKLYRLVRHDGYYTASGDGEHRRLMLLPELRSAQSTQVTAGWCAMRDTYAAVIRAGIDIGVFRNVNVAITAEMVTSAAMWSVVTWSREIPGTPKEIGTELAHFVLRSLLADPAQLDEVARQADALKVR